MAEQGWVHVPGCPAASVHPPVPCGCSGTQVEIDRVSMDSRGLVVEGRLPAGAPPPGMVEFSFGRVRLIEDEHGVHVVPVDEFDDGGPVSAIGPMIASTVRPEPGLSAAQEATFEVLRRHALADAQAEDARLRAELTDRVRAAINAQMDSWQGGVSLAEDLRAEKIDAAFAEAAVGAFVEFMRGRL